MLDCLVVSLLPIVTAAINMDCLQDNLVMEQPCEYISYYKYSVCVFPNINTTSLCIIFVRPWTSSIGPCNRMAELYPSESVSLPYMTTVLAKMAFKPHFGLLKIIAKLTQTESHYLFHNKL